MAVSDPQFEKKQMVQQLEVYIECACEDNAKPPCQGTSMEFIAEIIEIDRDQAILLLNEIPMCLKLAKMMAE